MQLRLEQRKNLICVKIRILGSDMKHKLGYDTEGKVFILKHCNYMIDSKVKGVHIESVKYRTAYKLCKRMFSNVIYYTIDDMKN